jgi:proteasome assembly chaperone (PAC2) family protein
MGRVAMTAGYHLMTKLGMQQLGEISAPELLDLDQIHIQHGLIPKARLPRARLLVWDDPREQHDVVLLLGEAQPAQGRYVFCRRLLEHALELHVERVITFAALATPSTPAQCKRVFGVATDNDCLAELRRLEVEIFDEGEISGLNGLLPAVGLTMGLPGLCLLGEIPQLYAQLPFPRAALNVLNVFTTMLGCEIDFAELANEAQLWDEQLAELQQGLERHRSRQQGDEGSDEPSEVYGEIDSVTLPEEPVAKVTAEQAQRIEQLFAAAMSDRSRAYELKRYLDQLDVFARYEDRFLDLFRPPTEHA